MLWGCLGWVLSVYGGFTAKMALVAVLEDLGRPSEADLGPLHSGHHGENSIFAVFADGLYRVWGGLWGCYGVIWVGL